MYAKGHAHGTRTQTAKQSSWYDKIAEENIARIEAEEDAERALVTALATQVGNAVTAMPEAARRIANAATLVQHHEVWPLTSGSYLVGSQSDTQAAHLVTRAHGWHCDCKHATYRQTLCSHILAAMLTVKLGTLYQPTYALPEAA
jgi:hypothetical protein